MSLILVMFGGAIGSGLRFLAGRAGIALLGPHYPWGTLFVNLTGGLLMGVLAGVLARHPAAGNEQLRLLIGVGVLGGYTTFSSFSLETVGMIQRGAAGNALGYVAISAAGAIAALYLGLRLVRGVPG